MARVVTSPDRQRAAAASSPSGGGSAIGGVNGSANGSKPRRPASARSSESLRPRPGGRATRVVSAVLQATLQEMARLGYQALRVEDVATRASVNKTTIYRRWPTKGDLVVAALREGARDLDFMPDTGTVREDMLALLEANTMSKDGTAFRAFISLALAEGVSPEIARFVRVLRLEYRERWISIVRRGITRGELPKATSAHLVAELAGAVPTVRRLRSDEPLDGETREAIVDLLLAGARATAGAVAAVDGEAPAKLKAPRAKGGVSRELRRRAV